RPGDGDEFAARLENADGFLKRGLVKAVQHYVVPTEQLREIVLPVVDDDIRAEILDQVNIARAGRRRHSRTELLGQLDGEGADAAGAGMDQNLLSLFQAGAFDQH